MSALYGTVFSLLYYADCATGRIQTGRTGLLRQSYVLLGSHVA